MKETVRTSRTAGYLEKIFRAINADSFGGVIEEPIITIQSIKGAYDHPLHDELYYWKYAFSRSHDPR